MTTWRGVPGTQTTGNEFIRHLSHPVWFIKELLLFEKNTEPIENKGGEIFFSNNET